MKEFEPNPFQKAYFEQMKEVKVPPILFPPSRNRTVYGVDMAEKGGDRTVITRAKMNGKGQITQIIFDEFSTFPDWKWYRHPIKWYKWRRPWKIVERNTKR